MIQNSRFTVNDFEMMVLNCLKLTIQWNFETTHLCGIISCTYETLTIVINVCGGRFD